MDDTEHGLTCMSWNESLFEPPKLAVGGYSRRACVLSFESNSLKLVGKLLFRIRNEINFVTDCRKVFSVKI